MLALRGGKRQGPSWRAEVGCPGQKTKLHTQDSPWELSVLGPPRDTTRWRGQCPGTGWKRAAPSQISCGAAGGAHPQVLASPIQCLLPPPPSSSSAPLCPAWVPAAPRRWPLPGLLQAASWHQGLCSCPTRLPSPSWRLPLKEAHFQYTANPQSMWAITTQTSF